MTRLCATPCCKTTPLPHRRRLSLSTSSEGQNPAPRKWGASSTPLSPARNCAGYEATNRTTRNAPRQSACRTTTSPDTWAVGSTSPQTTAMPPVPATTPPATASSSPNSPSSTSVPQSRCHTSQSPVRSSAPSPTAQRLPLAPATNWLPPWAGHEPAARRRLRLHRHLRGGERGIHQECPRREWGSDQLLRRNRQLPAACLHAQRREGTRLRREHAGSEPPAAR